MKDYYRTYFKYIKKNLKDPLSLEYLRGIDKAYGSEMVLQSMTDPVPPEPPSPPTPPSAKTYLDYYIEHEGDIKINNGLSDRHIITNDYDLPDPISDVNSVNVSVGGMKFEISDDEGDFIFHFKVKAYAVKLDEEGVWEDDVELNNDYWNIMITEVSDNTDGSTDWTYDSVDAFGDEKEIFRPTHYSAYDIYYTYLFLICEGSMIFQGTADSGGHSMSTHVRECTFDSPIQNHSDATDEYSDYYIIIKQKRIMYLVYFEGELFVWTNTLDQEELKKDVIYQLGFNLLYRDGGSQADDVDFTVYNKCRFSFEISDELEISFFENLPYDYS